ncbi:thioesterase superfamily protein [Peptococcaceae bacterium CEB3]|nr:thioesterase superfamily protein [Peptococcaceae bacterium CEB3]
MGISRSVQSLGAKVQVRQPFVGDGSAQAEFSHENVSCTPVTFSFFCVDGVHDRFFVSSGQIASSVEKGSYAKGAAERVEMEESTYRLCFVCGMDNHGGLRVRYTYANEEASAKVIIEDTFAGYPGVVHGGIVTTLLDETMAKTIEHLGIWAVTASMEVRFRHPTPVNTPLLLLGRRVKGETRLFRTEATLSLEDGTVLAEANGVFVKSPEPIAEKLG